MIEILKFIFSSFWVFIGTLFLLEIVGRILVAITAEIVTAFRRKE